MLLDDKEILRAEIEALKNKQLDNNSRLDCLSKENKALKDVIKTLMNESKDNIDAVKTLSEENNRLQVENKALRNKNMDKTKRQNILETEKEALQSEIETLKIENVQNSNKLETLTIAIAFAITITIAIAKDEFCTGNEVFKKGLENIIEEKILAQKKGSLKVEVEALRNETKDKGGGMHKELSVDVRSSKHLGKPETIKIAEDKKEAPTKLFDSDVDTQLNLRPTWSFKKDSDVDTQLNLCPAWSLKKDDVVDNKNKKKIGREMEGSMKKARSIKV